MRGSLTPSDGKVYWLASKRTIQERLLDPLSLRLLEGEFKPGDTIKVTAKGDALELKRKG